MRSDVAMKTVTGREISAMLNPRLAVLVTFCGSDGQPSAVTVAWHTPLSHEPALVGISLRSGSYAQVSIQSSGEFVINIVRLEFLEAIRLCGNLSGALVDKLARAQLSTHPAQTVQPPLLDGALGYLECRSESSTLVGDHMFVVGQVLSAEVETQAFTDAWEPSKGDGILCLQRDRFGCYIDIKEEKK